MKKKNILLACVVLMLSLFFCFTACKGESKTPETPEIEVTSVTISKNTAALLLGGEPLSLTATVQYSDGTEDEKITWKTSDESVATVENGVVTAVALGRAVITAAAAKNESVSQSCAIEVIQEASLSLNIAETSLIVGKGDAKLTAVVKRINGSVDNRATWTTSDSAAVTVSADGTITPVAVGEAEITATSTEDGKILSDKCLVHVLANADGLTNGTENGLSFTLTNKEDNALLGYSVKAENKDVEEAVIPDAYKGVRVTEIEAEAFRQCIKLTKFELGKSVVKIGANAFTMETEYEHQGGTTVKEYDRKKEVSNRLKKNITLNAGTQLSERSFADSFFREITIPEGVTEIPAYAFTGATVTKMILPTTLTEIRGYAFAGCLNLVSADLTHTKIVTIGAKGSDEFGVGNSFFQCGMLTTVGTLPATLKTIEAYSFSVCSNLTEIVLNDGLEKIGAQAFMQCSKIAEITVPASVVKIGETAFGRWGSTQKINVLKKQADIPASWNKNWLGTSCKAIVSYQA